MAMTPGRPHESSIHGARTRPEAEAIARKMRGESDWFRHDGKNVEEAEPAVPRLKTELAEEIAEKNRGNADEWFEHNAQNAPDAAPKERCPTQESKAAHDKVQGKDEKWFKMEENKDYHSPRPNSRVTDNRGQEIKEKNGNGKPNEWYRHDNDQAAAGGDATAERPGTGGGVPDWYGHENALIEEPGVSTPRSKQHARYTTAEAGEYLQRNKDGSASSWYSHDHQGEAAPEQPQSSRMSSVEGKAIASRLKGESEAWFGQDAKANVPMDRHRSKEAQDMVNKSRGGGMNQVMHQKTSAANQENPKARVKREAQDVAAKNQQGMMNKYLNEEGNLGYNSDRPAQRVKPEAQEAAAKNQGVMGDCMQGYLPSPTAHNQKRVKPEAAQNAEKQSGAGMGSLLGGACKSESPRRSAGARAVRPEAEAYASRNQGSLKGMMDTYGQMSVRDSPRRAPSSEAAAIAEKHKGSVASCFSYDNY
ncbi:hypothetical protein CAPTEDRAFT_223662 [Capitella teleta]|uniref:Uncharacterized protein n=1 Tax=Capitella teleta TaxID=283909 RepID=R7V190_CAPTE|nr:hypothetical protein CAPTEDRAFT_223662 [Capitella teleta]|eukprot:ELU09461.1 hypothetical protein CAPTEDRAFT_223662 [Capitella teleta]